MSTTAKCDCNKRAFYPAKVRAKVGEFERIISLRPGYRCSRPWGPGGDGSSHGQHCADIIFVLKGEQGAIQFLIYTGWTPEAVRLGQERQHFNVMPADIGYHSFVPRHEGHKPALSPDGEPCSWIGEPCYYDGSAMQAEEVYQVLVTRGEEAMWEELESYYREWLAEEPTE